MSSPSSPAFALWRQEARATAALAGPLVLTNLAQSAIQTTDIVLLGWLGARDLAAGFLGSNLYVALLIFGMGVVFASSPIMAEQLGRRRHSLRETRRTVRQAMWAAGTATLPAWVLLWQAEPILVLLGQEPALAADAARFTRTLMWGYLPALCFLVLRGFVAALERPLWALLIGIGGVLFNALINYGLIFGAFGLPGLGLVGAGLGSSLTQLFMFAGLALVVTRQRRFRRYRLFGNFWRSDWPRYRAIWRIGAPIAVTLALEVTVFNAAVFLMGLIGTDALAAHAIAIQVAALTFMVPLGLSQAVTVRVGLAYGRRDVDGIARAGWTAFALGTLFMSMAALVLLAVPGPIVRAFIDDGPANAGVIRLAISFLGIAALFQVVDGAQAVGAGMLRGLQDTTVPMFFAAFGYWVVGIGVGAWLGFRGGWGGVGIWVGLASGLAIVAVLMLTRWTARERLGLVRPH
jgi:multidrug resistance protein, MATE family